MFTDDVPPNIRNSYNLKQPEPIPPQPNPQAQIEPSSSSDDEEYIALQPSEIALLLKALGKLPFDEVFLLYFKLRQYRSGCPGCTRKMGK